MDTSTVLVLSSPVKFASMNKLNSAKPSYDFFFRFRSLTRNRNDGSMTKPGEAKNPAPATCMKKAIDTSKAKASRKAKLVREEK